MAVLSKILIIDTEQYAGNFEREMCAYITGQVGDCGVGEEEAEQEENNIVHLKWWNKHIAQEDPENEGCLRPASIWQTPGWFNNGLGKNYKDIPENEEIARLSGIESMKEYHKNRIEIIEKRLKNNDFETKKSGWTKENCLKELQSYENDIKRMETLTKYPAALSVAIFVDEFPPEEVWQEFINRANYYAKKNNITVTGFRQIEPEYKLKNKI